MDKIQKALAKLSVTERKRLKEILERLERRELKDLDVKKLRGRNDIFRVRKGDLRVLYRVQVGSVFILTIERRSDTTYRKR